MSIVKCETHCNSLRIYIKNVSFNICQNFILHNIQLFMFILKIDSFQFLEFLKFIYI